MLYEFEKSWQDPRVRHFLTPTRIVWQSGAENTDRLLERGTGQPSMWCDEAAMLKAGKEPGGIILDFGREIHGGVRIITKGTDADARPVKARIRFGESVSETMGAPDQQHAIHDSEVLLPWGGTLELGNTGFRFVRIDVLEEGTQIEIVQVQAVFLYRDLEYQGTFECSDERLNEIWKVGAYTVHLNMQDHVWDGIKRDRLVWIGDIHPESMVISTVFGKQDVLEKSLDLTRDETPVPQVMNGIGSYSLWWIMTHRDWYRYHGDLDYLTKQRDYLVELSQHIQTWVDENGMARIPAGFLDWPTSPDEAAVQAGLHALLVMSLRASAEILTAIDEVDEAKECEAVANRLAEHCPEPGERKTGWAMLALAGIRDAAEVNEQVLSVDPVRHVSTFYGYYILQARALAGDYEGAMQVIRDYWGAMLDFGATTFWEDFNIEWTENAARIDEIVPEGKKDLHADYGDYCYKGLRHSLCHGWAGGPTAWLHEHVLGVRPLEPGCVKLLVDPHLGDLEYAKGTFPTPKGVVKVTHEKTATGSVQTSVEAPEGIEIVTP